MQVGNLCVIAQGNVLGYEFGWLVGDVLCVHCMLKAD